MDNYEYKRLRRLLITCIIVIAILVVGIAMMASYQLSTLRNEFTTLKTSLPVPKDGENGLNGANGITEIINTYLPGKDGENATDEQVKNAVDKYFAEHPVKDAEDGEDGEDGKDGEPGPAGVSVFIRQNALGIWECRFGDDLGWSPIEECQ